MRWGGLLFALCVSACNVAYADEATQQKMELRFLEGRLHELDELVDPDDPWTQYILLARDLYWRRHPAAAVPEDMDQSNAALRQRLQWLREARTSAPDAAAGADDVRLPYLTALLRDRARREFAEGFPNRTNGHHFQTLDLTSDRATKAVDVGLILLDVYEDAPPTEREQRETAEASWLARRNARIGIGAVVALLLACAFLGLRLRPPSS